MKQIIIIFIFLLYSCESIETKKVISTDKAPQAIGPYSQAIQVQNTLYLAGQIALDPQLGQLVEGGIEVQTHRVMQNLNAVLEEAGFNFNDVVPVSYTHLTLPTILLV